MRLRKPHVLDTEFGLTKHDTPLDGLRAYNEAMRDHEFAMSTISRVLIGVVTLALVIVVLVMRGGAF